MFCNANYLRELLLVVVNSLRYVCVNLFFFFFLFYQTVFLRSVGVLQRSYLLKLFLVKVDFQSISGLLVLQFNI